MMPISTSGWLVTDHDITTGIGENADKKRVLSYSLTDISGTEADGVSFILPKSSKKILPHDDDSEDDKQSAIVPKPSKKKRRNKKAKVEFKSEDGKRIG